MAEVSKYTILIVEDDPSLREGIHDLLELEEDAEIFSVSNGIEALEMLETITPSLIISDIMMPLMNGFELLKEVRKTTRLVRVPFIFLTARGTREEVFEGRKSGAEMYITKPFNPIELVELAKIQLQRASEKQLASQEDISSLKRGVLQILNHEFRTPLTYVTAYYDMLAETIARQKDGRNLDEYLKGILSGCERLTDLIEDLILVMDVRSGTIKKAYHSESVIISDIASVIQSVINSYKPLADKNNIEIHLKSPNHKLSMRGVEEQLIILFSHLIENAVKFTTYTAQEKGSGTVSIDVSSSENGDWLNFEIIDSGIGVPEDAREKIFDLFYQHNRNYYEQQGSGSGLPIARGITQIYGGTIQIYSEPEQGCRVSLRLPSNLNEDASLQTGPIDAVKPLANVLLVEDDKALLHSLEELMQMHVGKYQFHTHSAENGRIALEILDGFSPDLIISDLMMPEVDGFELLKAVRQKSSLLHVPFIIVSARNRQQDIFDGRLSGAEEYITKPYDTEEFMTLVEVQLNRYFEHKQVMDQDFDNFKEKILSMLQPEFRTPLQSVSQSSNLLSGEQEQINTAEALRSTLSEIQTGSKKISELVEDFMSLAEIETGEAHKAFKSRASTCFDFSFLISEAFAYHQDAFDHNQIKTRMIKSNESVGALIEHASLQKALIRLIGIVTTFCISSEGNEISIDTKLGNEQNVLISVWHNGNHLDSDAVDHVYEMLNSQNDDVFNPMDFSSHFKIVDGFVKIHNGRFSFVSGAQGEHETEADRFIISLPKISSSPTLETKNTNFVLG